MPEQCQTSQGLKEAQNRPVLVHSSRSRASETACQVLAASMISFKIVALSSFLVALAITPGLGDPLIRPKVLVIATYEVGKDKGDVPGELQFWAEREHLDQSIKVPGIDHALLTNGKGLYAMVSGTTARSSIAVMTLAMDPRFDLSHTYFILSGIAGADPASMSIGSAVWVTWAVDGDAAYEIDNRETPPGWPYGIVALGATKPGEAPPQVESTPIAGMTDDSGGGIGKMAYQINPSLVGWAYGLTKDVTLTDTPAMAAWRAKFTKNPSAEKPPSVLQGGSLGTNKFWHGEIMNQWAEDWVKMYTKSAATLYMSDCEDQGICLAMQQLDRLHKVSFQRLLILRTASNFTVPPPGVAANVSLFDNLSNAPGYVPALDADYRAGSVVADELVKNWDKYEDKIP